ncbi:MAG TPA: DUF6531 domain-containing protein, partial [Candidatus Limnocylindrales bacterium]|nr:DUF6531 domain-containing protein [Candidatus Limnocylindrales bacterium]
MSRRFAFTASIVLVCSTLAVAQHSTHSQLDQYVEQVSELSARARANVYFTNPQSIFRGVQVSFVNVGDGNLTLQRRDMVVPGRIPLVFARVYDSSGKGSVDFGPGWTLSAAESITVADGKAHLAGENASSIDFVADNAGGFRLERDFPSDYQELTVVDENVLIAKLRTGFVKRFQRIGDVFRLVQVRDRNGNEVRLTYASGLLSKIENANHSIIILRDKTGRITSAQDDQNRSVQFAFNDKGQLTEAHDLAGRVWSYSYSADEKLHEARDPLNRLNFGASFDQNGQVRRLQLPSGVIQFSFDRSVAVTTVIDRKNLISRFFQNSEGITTRVINPLGEETAITLDNSRNPASILRNGSVLERMEFDDQHRLTARHTSSDSGMVDRQYSYDPATGQLASIQSSDGKNRSFTYDQNGNIASAVLPDGEHKFQFSPFGALSAISENGLSATFETDADGLFSSMTNDNKAPMRLSYKAGGQLKQAIFPGGFKSTYEYQTSGLRSRIALSNGRGSQYSYDPAGNLTGSKVFDNKGKQVNGQTLEMDDSYQLTKWTLFDGTVTEFKYDPSGNLTEIKKNKSVTRFEYDALNRLTAVVTPDGQRLTYTYKPGERSLIEQHYHAAVLAEDRRDTGFTFASQSQVLATRPISGIIGPVRFSENLGTFQLSGPDGAEILTPEQGPEASLKKMFLFDNAKTADNLRQGFNIPFNNMFIPGEYASINCCPVCFIDGGPRCPPCYEPPTPDPPTITGPPVVWYFGGATPAGYDTSITLTSSSGAGTNWSTASSKITLSATTGNSITVKSAGT